MGVEHEGLDRGVARHPRDSRSEAGELEVRAELVSNGVIAEDHGGGVVSEDGLELGRDEVAGFGDGGQGLEGLTLDEGSIHPHR